MSAPLTPYFGTVPDFAPGLSRVRALKSRPVTSRMNTRRMSLKASAQPKRSRLTRRNMPLYRTPVVTRTNFARAYENTKKLEKIPMFLVSAHSCICTKGRPCMGEEKPFAFQLPENTYVISLAQAGEFACPNEKAYWEERNELRKYLSMHSESDFNYDPLVGKDSFSLFSGIRRAVGGKINNSEHILYPNINFTINEYKNGALVSRDENPYGIYDMEKIPATFNLKNKNSVLPQNKSRNNWFLEDIINEVYRKLRIRSAIFVLGGCLSTCKNIKKNTPASVRKEVEDSIIATGQLMDIANAYYPTLRETYMKSELSANQDAPFNIGTYSMQAYPQVSEFESMLEEGLTDPAHLRELPLGVHTENRPNVEKFMKKKFVAIR